MNFPDLTRYPVVCLDLETSGLFWWKDRIFGVAVSTPDGRDYYWDVRNSNVMQWLKDTLHRVPVLVNQNMKFDAHFLIQAGIQLPKRIECTMVRAALLDEHLLSYGLDSLGKKYVGVGKDGDVYEDLARLFGGKPTKAAQVKNFAAAPEELMARYAKMDTNTALKLWQWQEGEIERQGLRRIVELETELLPVLVDMERGGVRVDVEKAERASKDISRILIDEQKTLDREAGFPVNPNPSASIHKLFNPQKNDKGQWVLNDGTVAESTGAGKASIDADCLRKMKHPLAAKILKMRKLAKAKDTFLNGHILGHHHDGIIHANFNQTRGDNELGTGTGRLSVNAPALQQISARDKDIAAIVRAVFIADQGCDWLSIDWAQVDFRVAAHYIQDPAIMREYAANADADFHQLTADITGLPRSPRFAGDPNSKQINLGLAFGMGSGKLAAEMGLPYVVSEFRGREFLKPGPEAEAVFDKYHGSMPGIKQFMDQASSVAKSRKFVRSLLGRHIRFPGGQFTHKAAGLLYQSGAADMQKLKIIECHSLAKSRGDTRLMLSVHDELNFSLAKGADKTREMMEECYCDFQSDAAKLKLRVPIRCSSGLGSDWWEASK